MKTKTLEGRLKIYEIALTDFLFAREAYKNNYDYLLFTSYAFLCNYFKNQMKLYHLDMQVTFPELYETRPRNSGYSWFCHTAINSRIKCLKRAIKITENKIKKQEKTSKPK